MTLPEDFIRRTRALFGARADDIFAALHEPAVRAARVNTLKLSPETFFALKGSFDRVPWSADGLYADGRLAGSAPYHCAGLYYMQEASAQLPVSLAADDVTGRVLDLCAAPGGKTCQLAALSPDILYANEVVYKRTSALKSNLERLGVRNALVTCNTADEYAERLPGFFDTVLVDAPCSGEGMFRKEPAAVANWSEANVLACAERSLGILCAAAETLKPGGVLIYSTCTLNYEENEGVIERFLAEHDFSLRPLPGCADGAGAGSPIVPGFLEHTARVLPSRAGEGHFTCRLVKNDGRAVRHAPLALRRPKADIKAVWEQVAACPMWTATCEADGNVYLAPDVCGRMNFLSYGVRVAELGKTVRPYHSLALALKKGETAQSLDLSPVDPRLKTYLSGGELADPTFSGWGTVTVDGWPLGLVKCGETVKNHLPKGLWI